MPTERARAEPLTSVAREEFETLLRPVLALAFRYAARLAGDRDAGMALVQDASVAAFRAFHQFAPGTNFKAWYLQILTHRYFQARRDQARTPTIALDDAPELFLYRQAKRLGLPLAGDAASLIVGRAGGDSVCRALDRLPDEYRVVATLHFLSETTYRECAEALGLPVGTVRSRLHRARRLLQVALWKRKVRRGVLFRGVHPPPGPAVSGRHRGAQRSRRASVGLARRGDASLRAISAL